MKINFVNETKRDVKEYKKLIKDVFKFDKTKRFFNLIFVDKETIQTSQNELYSEGLFNPIYTFNGELTGYAGDCALCTGYLACPPRTNVLKEGIYFNDDTYGTVRIVASSRNYPCGTILKFNVKKLSDEPILAIVLDRGVGGNVIDLLTESEPYAIKHVGRVRNLEFELLREGWKR